MRAIGAMLVAVSMLAACSTMQMQAALSCGIIGGVIGAAVGQGKKAVAAGAGISAAVCLAIATDMERRRKQAVAAERDLDRRIARRSYDVYELDAENRRLYAQLEEMRQTRAYLERTRDDGSEQLARLRARLSADAQGARQRLKIVDDRIAYIDKALRDSRLPAEQREAMLQVRSNLVQRRQILANMGALA